MVVVVEQLSPIGETDTAPRASLCCSFLLSLKKLGPPFLRYSRMDIVCTILMLGRLTPSSSLAKVF